MQPGQIAVGHPVVVATGAVYSSRRDLTIPGNVKLVWGRRYSTTLLELPATALGPGWSNRYFASLTHDLDAGQFRFFTPEGYVEIFADPDHTVDRGGVIRNLGTFQELAKEDDLYLVTRFGSMAGPIERYVFREDDKGVPWALSAITNVAGQALDLLYDRKGRLEIIRQRREKRALHLDYDQDGRITTVSFLLPDNETQELKRYEYDDAGCLQAAYDALGHADRYEYDRYGRMTRELAKDGGVFSFRYDERGRCLAVINPDHYDDKTFRYLEHIGWTEVTDSLGYVTRYQWLQSGQVIRQIDPLGGEKRTEYDEYGRITAKTNAVGAVAKYEYDGNGNRCAYTNALNETVRLEYNDRHLPVTVVDVAGQPWEYHYDGRNRLIRTVNPLGHEWFYAYTPEGDLASSKNPLSGTISFIYNEIGDLIQRVELDGSSTVFTFDAHGNRLTARQALGREYAATYNELEQMTSCSLPNGRSFYFSYDAGGNLTAIRDALGRVTRYHFSSCRRLQSIVKPNGDTLRFRWGSEPNRLIEIINEKGESYHFEFDAAGRLIKETSYDGRIHQYEYDAAHNLTAFVNGLGRRITYEHDPLGRFTATTLSDAYAVKYRFGPRGLVAASSPGCALTFEYDALGRIIKESLNGMTVEKTFNPLNRCLRIKTGQGDSLEFTYDVRGLLQAVSRDAVPVFLLAHDEQGMEVSRGIQAGASLANEYDPGGRLIRQTLLAEAPGEAFACDYAYDQAGSLARIVDSRWHESRFVYDELKRLTGALREQGHSESFAYDPAGNLTAVGAGAIRDEIVWRRIDEYLAELPRTECLIAPGSRLLERGTNRYEYDGEGNLVKKATVTPDGALQEWRFAWDDRGQLTELTRPNGDVWRYFYDAFGRRYRKTGPRTTTDYVWNRNVVVAEVKDAKRSLYVFHPDSFAPIGLLADGHSYCCVNDPIGRPVMMFDRQGRHAWSARFKSWGELEALGSGQADCQIRFPGQWFDAESGLHYNRFRYYDPQTGRYLSPDPLRTAGALNLYWYANSPFNDLDPFGLNRPPGSDTPAFQGGHHTLPGAMFDSPPGEGVTDQSVAAYNQEGWRPTTGYDESHSAIHGELARQMQEQGYQTNAAPYPSRDALSPFRELPVDERIQALREIYNSDEFATTVFGEDSEAHEGFLTLFEQEAERVQNALEEVDNQEEEEEC